MPWLLGGGTLACITPSIRTRSPRNAARTDGGTHRAARPALAPLAEAGCLGGTDKTIVALWRSPERLAASAAWRGEATLVDVASFGEIGLLAARRGLTACRRRSPAASSARRTAPPARSRWPRRRAPTPARWRCAARWCRRTPFRPAPSAVPSRIWRRTRPASSTPASPAGSSATANTLTITGPPAGITSHRRLPLPAKRGRLAGGDRRSGRHHRRPARRRCSASGWPAAPPDRAATAAELHARGANPLIAGAFRPRKRANAA